MLNYKKLNQIECTILQNSSWPSICMREICCSFFLLCVGFPLASYQQSRHYCLLTLGIPHDVYEGT